MVAQINLPLILAAALLAVASPGPATLAIAGTSMSNGRLIGLAMASGVTTGSLIWSIAAGCGLSALMLANAWALEAIRYFGAAYLLYLAFKSGHSALSRKSLTPQGLAMASPTRAYAKGLALHLTNPKAILFFGSLYSFGVSASASFGDIAEIVAAVGAQSFLILHGYALLFSSAPIVRGYVRARRWFEGAFAVAFGLAGLKILSAKFQS